MESHSRLIQEPANQRQYRLDLFRRFHDYSYNRVGTLDNFEAEYLSRRADAALQELVNFEAEYGDFKL